MALSTAYVQPVNLEKMKNILKNRNEMVARMRTLEPSLKNEQQLKELLQLQDSKEKCDEMLLMNENEITKNQNNFPDAD